MEIEQQLTDRSFEPFPGTDDVTPALPEPGPDNPPWNSLEAVGVWIASVVFILIVPTVVLLPYLASRNPPLTESAEIVAFATSDPTAVILQILAILPAHFLTLLLAWFAVTRARKYRFREMLGARSGGFAWWYYVVILISFMSVAFVVSYFVPEQENDLLRILRSSRSAVYIVAFIATFTAPLVEEVVYRGVLYSAFQRTIGVGAAFVLVTLLFAVVHVPQYYPSYSTIFLLTLLSVTLTWIRVKSGNLLPCIILHTLFNALQSVFLLLEPLMKSLAVPEQVGAIIRFLK